MEPFDGAEDAAGPWTGRLSSVYLAAWPRYIKLGYSRDPVKRVAQLNTPSVQRLSRAPADLDGTGKLIGLIYGAGRDVEQVILALLEKDRVSGEWFRRGKAAERAVRVFGKRPYCLYALKLSRPSELRF